MTAETNHDGTVPLSEEPKTREWLIEIMKGKDRQDSQTKAKPQIQKVAGILRETESNKTCFDPLVVSFGPYHHGKARLRPMESYKEVAARWFFSLSAGNKPENSISDVKVKNVYDKFVAEATKELSPRENYADNFIDIYNQAEFMKMMFLDGCFILYFIHLVVKVTNDLPESSHLNQPHILRDMFLLENQIPYSILEALMSLLPHPSFDDVIIEFIYVVFLPPYDINLDNIGIFRLLFFIFKNTFFPKWNHPFKVFLRSVSSDDRRKPLHLLDLLRALLIGVGASPSSSGSGYWHYYFRPVRELKATGIQVRRSSVTLLRDVKFKKGLANSHLELPQLIVDESTKTRLLNLVAYEMCSDGLLDRTVTSYICFLDSLIYNTEDVKELRSKNILLNRLGSNEEVVKLFKELAAHSSPDYSAYGDVITGIDGHCKRHLNHTRVLIGQWTSQFTRTYFTTPWTVISLIAAILVISLTLVQTIYTALSFYKTD